MYAQAADIRREIAALARPPLRMPVSEAAEKFVRTRSSGGTPTEWSAALTPYMVEPMNVLTSAIYEALFFAGPARTGKTQALIDCRIGHNIKCAPADMAVVQISQEKAKDFSKLRVDYMLRHSPELAAQLTHRKQDDNVHEKFFKQGNVLKIIWPTVKQLSSSEFETILLTDYDRMPQDVDREGSPFELARKRVQTYLSRGMAAAESSPGREMSDPKWTPRTPHEAPPTDGGILSLYNEGDRRRWYMPCPHCGEYFMPAPGIEAFSFATQKDAFGYTDAVLAGPVYLICTANGCEIEAKHKHAMNAGGVWVPEGCHVEHVGGIVSVVGQPRKTKAASFWLPGAAAAYQSWESIVERYLTALREYEVTGNEDRLKTTTNVDQGTAYLPRRLMSEISAADIERRAEDLPKRQVPDGTRFLVATVDVQGNRFVVQVLGIGVGLESWLIDRFDIHISQRLAGGEPMQLDPAGYVEDWDLITEKVIKRSYPLADGSGRTMAVFITGCDSGGRAGVTDRAYEFWRRLKKKNLHRRFMLLKGERPLPHARKPTVQKSYPDNTKRADRKADARGDVPVWILNTTLLKDAVAADMKRLEHGPRYMHYPDWLSLAFYEELTAEVRTEKGWENPQRARNETFDLYTYAKGIVQAVIIEARMQSINWDNPPSWAAEWNNNSQINMQIEESAGPRRRRRGVISKGVQL